MTREFSADEMIAACISRHIQDGDVVVQGLATPLTMAGYILAKLTHAPNAVLASAIGNAVTLHWRPLSLSRVEEMWLDAPLHRLNFSEIACELLTVIQPKEFLRPAQVDQRGDFNNVVIGDWHRPRLRLPGGGGIADITTFESRVYLYVPRHTTRTFVERVDFRSGLGTRPGVESDWYLVTDLGTFDLHEERVRLKSVHPGVSADDVQASTGFALEAEDPLETTEPPTGEETRLLRDVIDPFNIRRLETTSGNARRALLRDIIRRESEQKE
jgi:glutaconate CoA-transferase subunit B